MKRRMLCMFAVLCLLIAAAMPVYAADSGHIADYADLLTDMEEQQLAAEMADTTEEYDCGVYLVTVADYSDYGSTPYDAAVELYSLQSEDGNLPGDGILLMLSMQERDYSLITYGAYAEAVYPDAVMWEMEEHFLYYFAQNRWFDGFACYVGDAERALADYDVDMTEQYGDRYESYYEPGVPDVVLRFNRVQSEIWLAVGVGSLAVALVVCLVMKAGMRTARKATHANEYIPTGGVNLRVKQDLFTHTTTRVIHHPKQNSGGSGRIGGGGFRGHSGKF